MAKNAFVAAFAAATFLFATPVLAVTIVQASATTVHAPVRAAPVHAVAVRPTSNTYLRVGGWLIVVVAFAMIGGISRRRSPSRIVAS